MLRRMASFLIPALVCIGMWATVSWASVDVYAEGAYTKSDLVVYIYVDVDTDPILSYGVKLTYDETALGSPVVEKNSDVWFFGEHSDPLPTPNAEPDTSTPGEVIIVGGKLDSAAPQEGVKGDRKLLAKVTFDRINTNNIPSAELYLGKGGKYSNFVQVNGEDLDETLGGEDKTNPIGIVTIFERGDANGDGSITNIDMGEVKRIILGMSDVVYRCYADANDDGSITNVDMGEIKTKILGIE